jgi:hypothetical protein
MFVGRRKKYTERGISRVPCCRCGEPSMYQWQCCANGNRWMGLCPSCDVDLNRVTLEWMGHPHRDQLIEEYRKFTIGGAR